MQLIFQDPTASLDPKLRIGRIVSEGIRKHRIAPPGEAEKIAADMLALCGIDSDSMSKFSHEFSGGQKQRIGIARALAVNPRFVVADEALSALDVSVQSQILNLLQDLRDRLGLTFLFISHDLRTVEYFCDRVGILYQGRLVECGPTSEVLEHPQDRYTRELLSSLPRRR
jgi:ABC-type glutathione transport system ATPase component